MPKKIDAPPKDYRLMNDIERVDFLIKIRDTYPIAHREYQRINYQIKEIEK
jgi:proline dehydrogenase